MSVRWSGAANHAIPAPSVESPPGESTARRLVFMKTSGPIGTLLVRGRPLVPIMCCSLGRFDDFLHGLTGIDFVGFRFHHNTAFAFEAGNVVVCLDVVKR